MLGEPTPSAEAVSTTTQHRTSETQPTDCFGSAASDRDDRLGLREDPPYLSGSRAKAGGMPGWKRVANWFLTTVENLVMRRQFTECHTGYRAYSRRFLETVPFLRNSNGFSL